MIKAFNKYIDRRVEEQRELKKIMAKQREFYLLKLELELDK